MTVSESPDELTLRAEEVGPARFETGTPSVRRSTKVLKDKAGWNCVYNTTKKKPNEKQKAKTLWKMKAAKDYWRGLV